MIYAFDPNADFGVIEGGGKGIQLTKQDAKALNGGWQCYLVGDSKQYYNEPERYMHADIDTDGEDFNLTLRWGYFEPKNGGESIDENDQPAENLKGKWDSDTTVHTFSEIGNIDISEIY